VGIFRRRKDGTNDSQDGPETLEELDATGTAEGEADELVDTAGVESAEDVDDQGSGGEPGVQEAQRRAPVVVDRSEGPFDRDEVDGPEGRLDLGSLWIAGTPGMELRLEVDEESQSIVGATAMLGESAVHLQAFAAPKSSGIWDDIRAEIAASITGQGGTVEQVEGPLGPELQTRMPSRAPGGRTTFSPARFVGVDGPRWFLRAVLSGRGATDADAGGALLDFVRQTVVVRGTEAMAPRELLPLQLPEPVAPTGQDAPETGAEGAEDDTDVEDFTPFERGPEITEIR
jgi:hypothetical protein